MKIAIIHLSDIHFKDDSDQNFILSRTDKISAAIQGYSRDVDFCFLVISGDISYSGKTEEYQIAEKFIDDLCLNLITSTIKNIKVVIVPGNHDCDFSGNQSVRNALLQQILVKGLEDDSIADTCVSVQNDFIKFRTSIERKINGPQKNDLNLFEEREFEIGGKQVAFYLINSAWMSTINEQQSKLLFPVDKINPLINIQHSPDLVISILHHPYSWFESNNSRELRKKIEALADIVLTGHEHEEDAYTKSKLTGETVEYIEGGVLQEKFLTNSSFNLLILDLENNNQRIFNLDWNATDAIYECAHDGYSIPLKRNITRPQFCCVLNQAFQNDVNDLGIKFSHPILDEVSIDDVFVFPDLRRLYAPNNQDLPKTVIREQIKQFIIEEKHVVIIGADKSGKTILSKKLFSTFLYEGLIPLLIDGDCFKDSTENHIETYIKRRVAEIYLHPKYNVFL